MRPLVTILSIVFPVFLYGSQAFGRGQMVTSTDSLPGREKGFPQRPEDISPLLVGEKVPDVTLADVSGNAVGLSGLVSSQPTILVFYRGSWCPYCSLQMSGLQEIEGDLRGMGYRIVAISTDSPENLRESVEKQQLTYILLSDADLSVAIKFGLAYKSPASYDRFLPATSGGKNLDKLIPVPSVFFVDRKGTILFEYISTDIKQRISAALLKAAAEALRDAW